MTLTTHVRRRASLGWRKAEVVATHEGLAIDGALIARKHFNSAVLHHESSKTFVVLHGRRAIDVEVPSNVEGDALITALGLDAKSAAVEFTLAAPPSQDVQMIMLAVVLAAVLLAAAFRHTMTIVVLIGLAVGLIAIVISNRRAHLRVGADGLLLRRPFVKDVFFPHEAIKSARSEGDVIILDTLTAEGSLRLTLPASPQRAGTAERLGREDEAANIVRRVQQARAASRDLGANAPSLSLVLARRKRTTRDWLAELRRIGRGASAAYREIDASREQLLRLVESADGNARERIIAMVALMGSLTEEEKPRVRVAAQRIAEPDARERMLRVLDASDDETLERVLDKIELD